MNKRRAIKKRSKNHRDYNVYISNRKYSNNYFSQEGLNHF